MSSFPGFFITGSDTDAGKTLVSSILMKLLKGTYWKPVQSGSNQGTDRRTVQMLTGLSDDHFLAETYVFKEPFSPNQAAKIEHGEIDSRRLVLPDVDQIKHKPLIIEGAGGVFVPLNDHDCYIDIMQRWSVPVIIVCRNRLGVINHMLLTIEALKNRNIPIAGFISSGGNGNRQNLEDISRFGGIRLLGSIPEMKHVDIKTVGQVVEEINQNDTLNVGRA
jgi:dethiobiotin synthase